MCERSTIAVDRRRKEEQSARGGGQGRIGAKLKYLLGFKALMRKPVKMRGLGFWVLREARQCDWTRAVQPFAQLEKKKEKKNWLI